MNPFIIPAVVAVALFALIDGDDAAADNLGECREGEGVVKVIKNDDDSIVVEVEDRDEDRAVCNKEDQQPDTGREVSA